MPFGHAGHPAPRPAPGGSLEFHFPAEYEQVANMLRDKINDGLGFAVLAGGTGDLTVYVGGEITTRTEAIEYLENAAQVLRDQPEE